MKLVTDPTLLKSVRRPVVLAAGFFDGVHRGHARVIEKARARASELDGEAWILSFDMHPLKLLRPEIAPRMLTSTGHKLLLFERMGVDGCILLPFTRPLAAMEARAFLEMLTGCLPSLREMHVGRDWRFGRGGAGDVPLLRALGRQHGFGVRVAPPVMRGGSPVSSTRIREEIELGRLVPARAMLGRPFSVMGTVIPGRQVGRQLGFPTANLESHNEILPPCGVYAVHAWLDGIMLDGVANYGTRPTFRAAAGSRPVLEMHLLDFGGNVYGRQVEIFFVARLRPEKTFGSTAELAGQLADDVRAARRMLAQKNGQKNIKESLYTFCATHYSPATKVIKKRYNKGNRLAV